MDADRSDWIAQTTERVRVETSRNRPDTKISPADISIRREWQYVVQIHGTLRYEPVGNLWMHLWVLYGLVNTIVYRTP